MPRSPKSPRTGHPTLRASLWRPRILAASEPDARRRSRQVDRRGEMRVGMLYTVDDLLV